MKKIIYLVLLLIVSFAFVNVHAATCTEQDKEKLVTAAKNIKITYQHTGGVFFDLIITNLSKDMYLYDEINERDIKGTGDVITLNHYFGGKVYSFMVFAKSGPCSIAGFYTILVKVPTYNTYADTEYCTEHPDFKYCDPWYNGYISLEAFTKGIEEYEAEQNKKEEKELNKSVVEGLIDFYKDYKYYIIGGVALIIVSVSAIIIYSVKSRRTIKL